MTPNPVDRANPVCGQPRAQIRSKGAPAREDRDPPSYEQVKSDPVPTPTPTVCCTWRPTPVTPASCASPRRGRTARARVDHPPIPLTTAEMDYGSTALRAWLRTPAYADEKRQPRRRDKIPAWEMIRFSINIMRGLWRLLHLCSITEHEGLHHPESRIRRFDHPGDRRHPRQGQGFTRHHFDLGGPTANMYRLCRSPEIAGRLPQTQLRVPRHLPEPHDRPRPAHQDCRRPRTEGIRRSIGSGFATTWP